MLDGGKRTINILSNIDNYLGEHEGRLAPVLIFLGISAAPVLLYIFVLQALMPFKVILVFEILWAARFALYILGGEKQKLAQYRKERQGVYKTADQIIRVSQVTKDGLIEYSNGSIAYMLVGYIIDYVDDDSMTLDFESFLKQLRGYEYDIYSQMVVDEYRLQDDIDKLQVYENKQFLRERMLFYQEQDEYCSHNAEAYRICILVKGSKYAWKELRTLLERAIHSECAVCWQSIAIAEGDGVSGAASVTDIFSRDLCLDVDINDMLIEKYKSDEFYGSKVLFYGDDIPEEYRQQKESANLNARRVVVK